MRGYLLIALAIMAALPARAAREVSDFTLDNGLRLVVIEDHRAPAAMHMVWYRVGAADEPPGKSGIAHYLEHLMFKGTEENPAGSVDRIVSAVGGSNNAFTSPDATAYFERVPADALGQVMALEGDRMRNLAFEDALARTELQVVVEERNQRVENNPGAIFSEQFRAAQYLNHPYGDPIIGWPAELAGLTPEDARAFYKRFYAPDNAIVVVAGDVDPATVRALAETHYGTLAPTGGLGPRARPQEPPQRAARRVVYSDPRVGQPYLMRSYLAPERDAGDQARAAALEILARVLGGEATDSALSDALQFDRRIAVQSGASYRGTALDDTEFRLYVVPRAGVSLDEAEKALDSALARFMREGPDPARLERVKMRLYSGEIYARDEASTLARRYGRALTSGLTLDDVAAWPDLLQSVTAEDVMAAAREVLVEARSVTGRLMRPETVTPAATEGAE